MTQFQLTIIYDIDESGVPSRSEREFLVGGGGAQIDALGVFNSSVINWLKREAFLVIIFFERENHIDVHGIKVKINWMEWPGYSMRGGMWKGMCVDDFSRT